MRLFLAMVLSMLVGSGCSATGEDPEAEAVALSNGTETIYNLSGKLTFRGNLSSPTAVSIAKYWTEERNVRVTVKAPFDAIVRLEDYGKIPVTFAGDSFTVLHRRGTYQFVVSSTTGQGAYTLTMEIVSIDQPSNASFIAAGPPACFAAGTSITTPAGVKRIEDVRIHDMVLAYDEKSGKVVPREVTDTMVHGDRATFAASFSDGSKLTATAEHPFFRVQDRRWVQLKDLRKGDAVYKVIPALLASQAAGATAAPSLKTITFNGLRPDAKPTTVYNFTVKEHHDYFAGSILVHNKAD